ncbi:MAG: glycosyltransferase family A protein [Chitinophagaceae bacterium]
MFISIIAPIYKVEDYIERFIRSIVAQSDKDFELILVDDCSPDQSIDKAVAILDGDAGVRYRVVKHPENKGVSAARNSGLAHVSTAYVYFVDGDDELATDAVAAIKNAIVMHPDSDIMYFNARYFNQERNVFLDFFEEKVCETGTQAFMEQFLSGNHLAYLWTYVCRYELFENVAFPDQVGVFEDAMTLPFLIGKAARIHIDTTRYIYRYYPRDGSSSRSLNPHIMAFVAAFNQTEKALFPPSHALYYQFILFRTTYLMRLSREVFFRAQDKEQALAIHRHWSKDLPSTNYIALWKMKKRKSALFLYLLKRKPAFIALLYGCRVLK